MTAFGKPRKRFSQNFLQDRSIASRIVGFLELSPGDVVFEIGPGRGILTELIAETGVALYAFEIDRDLIAPLTRKFEKKVGVRIVNRDFLTVQPGEYGAGGIKVIGNIPYDITSPVIDWLVKYRAIVGRAVITAQKELAERITSGPGSRHWAPISIFSQYFYDMKLVMTIPAGAFFPRPKVISATILMEPKNIVSVENWDIFEKVVRGAFTHRRKLLVNNLALLPGITKEALVPLLEQLGFQANIRAEQVTTEKFLELAAALKPLNNS